MSNVNIKLYQVFNWGDFRSVVNYGTLPNSRGPAGNGYSVLTKRHGRAVLDWSFGSETIVAETRLRKRYTWKIYTMEDRKLHLFVSMGGSEFVKVGAIQILHEDRSFNLWTCGDSIVIENDDHGLARESDGQSFRYFQVFNDRISFTNNPPV